MTRATRPPTKQLVLIEYVRTWGYTHLIIYIYVCVVCVEEIIIAAVCHEDDDGSGLNERHYYKGVAA